MKNPSDFVDMYSKEDKKAQVSGDSEEENHSALVVEELEIEVDFDSSSSFGSENELIDIE